MISGSESGLGPENAFGFSEFLASVKNNATKMEITKNFLSALVSLSERSDNSPRFMLWTIPTTLFALLGLVYFIGKPLTAKQNQI